MDTPTEQNKKIPLEDLSKEEIIKKYHDLIVLLKKAMQNKELLTKENSALKEKLEGNVPVTNELVESLTQQKLGLVSDLDEAKSQKDAILNSLKKTETELHEARNKINELDIENKSSERRIQRLSEENEQLLLHLDSLENKLGDKAKNMEAQVGSLDREKSDLSNELRAKQMVISELQKNNDELTAQYRELKGNIETLEKNYQNAEMIICELRATVKQSSQQREVYLSETDDLNVELHKNKALVEKLQQDLKSMSSKLSHNQIELSGYASDLQNTNEKLKEKLKQFHSKLVKFATDVKLLKQEKTNILENFKNYIEQAKLWEAQLKQYAQKMLTAFQTMEVENSELKMNLDRLTTEKSTELSELKSELDETKASKDLLNEQIRHLRDENEAQLANVKKENLELLGEMNEMNQALKTRGEAISKQQEYCEDLLANIKHKETVIKEHLQTIQSKDDIISSVEGELRLLKQDTEVQINEKIDMREVLDKKDQEIGELQKEVAHLQENLNAALNSSQDVNYAESETMSTSTISKSEESNRLKDLDGSWEERYGAK
uniref:Uncharacterized protein n=1 Tax=Photinus pyralis TaxID=7054 RepID=A0A1Y1KCF5_PHOPY